MLECVLSVYQRSSIEYHTNTLHYGMDSMSGLNIFTSNKLEILVEQLAQMVKTPV